MWTKRRAVLDLLLLSGSVMPAGCGAAPVEAEADGTGLAWDVSRNAYRMSLGGAEREFIVHVPEHYSGDAPTPLLFMLHGASGDGDRFHRISGWVEKAEEEGFIAVFPTDLAYPIAGTNRMVTRWSADGSSWGSRTERGSSAAA